MEKCKKFFVSLFVVCIIFTFNCASYAAVNSNYGTNNPIVAPSSIDEQADSNPLVEALGGLIYMVTSAIEYIVSGIFESFSGSFTFPWADKIIFNALPVLDINFINPSRGSLFLDSTGTQTAISRVLSSSYYTVFTIAVAFFGVCVGIMALRLVFSSIASEKARYKQAITQWTFALILLFLSHYAISFIFYINEQMVEIATTILDNAIKDANIGSLNNSASKNDIDSIANNFIADQIERLKNVNEIEGEGEKRSQELAEKSASYSDIRKKYIYYLVTNDTYLSNALDKIKNSKIWHDYDIEADQGDVALSDAEFLESIDLLNDSNEAEKKIEEHLFGRDNSELLKSAFLNIWQLKSSNSSGTLSSSNTSSTKIASSAAGIFDNMGDFFKTSAHTYETNKQGNIVGWKQSKISTIGVILYAIFTLQSLMFLIAYTKRFFYVTILALFAPMVIVFDFVTKSVK